MRTRAKMKVVASDRARCRMCRGTFFLCIGTFSVPGWPETEIDETKNARALHMPWRNKRIQLCNSAGSDNLHDSCRKNGTDTRTDRKTDEVPDDKEDNPDHFEDHCDRKKVGDQGTDL